MKTLLLSVKVFAVFTLLTGLLYPLAVTGLGWIVSAGNAGGSLVEREGRVVGSKLIAQSFEQAKYFWPRPSAVKYDSSASGGSNQGPTSADLLKAVQERRAAGAVAESRYASASGLDPHVSPESALSQVERVAKARGAKAEEVESLVISFVEGRQFGFLGQPTVNVLLLNLALDQRIR